MTKFCTKCGKELKNGEVCACEKEKETKVVETSSIDIKESCVDCLNMFKGIFTKPFDTIKNFVCDSKWLSGVIMIIIAAISSGLYKIATLKNLYSSNNVGSFSSDELLDAFASALSGNSVSSEPEYFKEFINQFITSFAEYALIAVIGYIIISSLLKSETTWKKVVSAVALSVTFVIAGNLINSVLVFIDGEFISNIRGYITTFAYISSIIVLYEGIKETIKIDKNKLYLVLASMSVGATLIIDIVKKIFD